MTNRDSKIIKLLDEGFSYETVKKMSNYHIDRVYNSLIKEASTFRVPADKLKDVENDLPDDATIEVTEDDVDNIHPFKGQQTQDPKQVGPSTDDGDGNYQDGMNEYSDNYRREMEEGFDEDKIIDLLFGSNKKWDRDPDYRAEKKAKSDIKPHYHRRGDADNDFGYAIGLEDSSFMMDEGKKKMKTPITTLGMFEENNEYAICMDSIQGKYGPKKDWSKNAQEKFDACVTKVGKETKEEKVRQIEESIVSLIKKTQGKVLTKKDILSEEPKIAPARPTVKPGTKPERGTPYQPKHSPKPKAGTEVKPARPTVKPGTKPERGTPYQPKHSPKPKAGTEVKPARPTVKPGVKPERGTPYQPKHSPKPKAGNEGGLPEFLTFNNLNIKFRDE